ncbi:transposase, partial [bacterium]|nr:transposase [bacterium]
QNTQQIFSKKVRQKPGHIVSFQPDSRFQMDLVDMSKFATQNNGYKWIMTMIDIFSRKLYVYLMKNKTEENILAVLNKFFDDHQPDIIMSDNESGFKAKSVQRLMDKEQTDNILVEPNDHKALGVIDRAIQTLKNAIYKYMKEENTTTYIKELPKIVEAYNDTPHSGIMDIAPNDAEKKENKDKIQIMNHKFDLENRRNRVKFRVGDTVRIRTNRKSFVRSYDEKYSDKQYTITELNNRRATLDNGEDYDIRRLIKVEKVEIPERTQEKLTERKKEARIERKIKDAGVDESNVVNGKRARKPNSRFAE